MAAQRRRWTTGADAEHHLVGQTIRFMIAMPNNGMKEWSRHQNLLALFFSEGV